MRLLKLFHNLPRWRIGIFQFLIGIGFPLCAYSKLPLILSASQKINLETEIVRAKTNTPLDPENQYAAKNNHHGELIWLGQSNLTLYSLQAQAEWFGELGYVKDSEELQKTLIPSHLELDWRPWGNFKGAIGIKKWNSGVAYAWNPSNPFGDRKSNNSDGVTYRRQGDPFFQLVFVGSQWNIEALLVEQGEDDQPLSIERETYHALATAHVLLDRMDMTISLGHVHGSEFSSMAFSSTVSEGLEIHGEVAWWKQYQQWKTIAKAVPGFSDEAFIYSLQPEIRENGIQSALGGQYTFSSQTNLLMEYLYQGTGMSPAEYMNWLNAAAYASEGLSSPLANAHGGFLAQSNSLPGFIRRHYVFARVMQPMGERGVVASVYLRSNLEEAGDFLTGGSLFAPLADAVTLKLYGAYYGEIENTETQLIPTQFSLGSTIQFIF